MFSSLVPTIDTRNPMYCPHHPVEKFQRPSKGLCSDRSNPFPTNFPSYSSDASEESSVEESAFLPVRLRVENAQKRKEQPHAHANVQPRKRSRSESEASPSSSRSSDPSAQQIPMLLHASSSSYSTSPPSPASFPPDACDPVTPRHRIYELETEFYGFPIGPDTPNAISRLLARLNRELPGIHLSRRVSALKTKSHQSIINLLGFEGYLAYHILKLFRRSKITKIDLTATLSTENGLNELSPSMVLRALALPHGFTNLRILILDDVRLDDFDITKIHHLPALSSIHLNNTHLGDESIFHLISLKRQLTELHLEDNPRITDDCIPSLCFITKLTILSLYGTSIEMAGLRRLCISMNDSARRIDLSIPFNCEKYLKDLHKQYQFQPVAPMITDPNACSSLSVNALKANLAGHAQFNPTIYLSGSKPELIDRLRGILERREADQIVRDIVYGQEESGIDQGELEGNEVEDE